MPLVVHRIIIEVDKIPSMNLGMSPVKRKWMRTMQM